MYVLSAFAEFDHGSSEYDVRLQLAQNLGCENGFNLRPYCKRFRVQGLGFRV